MVTYKACLCDSQFSVTRGELFVIPLHFKQTTTQSKCFCEEIIGRKKIDNLTRYFRDWNGIFTLGNFGESGEIWQNNWFTCKKLQRRRLLVRSLSSHCPAHQKYLHKKLICIYMYLPEILSHYCRFFYNSCCFFLTKRIYNFYNAIYSPLLLTIYH